MRTILATMVGMAFVFTAACGGGKPTTSTSGGGSGSGSTTGGSQGKQGGDPCGSNSECQSLNCEAGTLGGGLCCNTTCQTSNPNDICQRAVGCSDAGACLYPPAGTFCTPICVNGSQRNQQVCDQGHVCVGGTITDCPNHFSCGASDCNTSCSDAGGCAIGYYCNGGICTAQIDVGPCGSGSQCTSGVCGSNSFCCGVACPPSSNDPLCNANGCTSDAGTCQYPEGKACTGGLTACSGSTESFGTCNFTGFCDLDAGPCPDNLACASDNKSCVTKCHSLLDCAQGYYCKNLGSNITACFPQQADGGCSLDDQCLSGICGLTSKGHCCAVGCKDTDDAGVCGATDCDGTTAACNYPGSTTSCGKAESCATVNKVDTQQNPFVCNGAGDCPDPGTTLCAPFVCNGTTACNTTCTDSTACDTVNNDFCDSNPAALKCCSWQAAPYVINVDGALGVDGPCCGLPTQKNSCATISYAMKMIDGAGLKNVKILAKIKNGGGDWKPVGEVYPIVLGWGVELSAAGINFLDPLAGGAEIFDIKAYSATDTVGYASISGQQGNPVNIGFDQAVTLQTADSAGAVVIEDGNTLYLANVTVNGSTNKKTPAITVAPGAVLTLGENQATTTTGQVTIGNRQGPGSIGWTGILCQAGTALKSCTINDDPTILKNGSSVVFMNQSNVDLEADDYASISLQVAPTIGVAPGKSGYGNCPTKNDLSGATSKGAAVFLHGPASVDFENGTVQCLAGQGFHLEASANGTPTLTLTADTIQNTELGLYVAAGTATVSTSTFQFNYNGVELANDGTNASSIDLSGGAIGANTVVCSSNVESSVANQTVPGVDVLNTTNTGLTATNVAWDTPKPDYFTCTGALATTCSCVTTPCANTAGANDMNAVVDIGSGSVTTAGNTVSTISCQ